MLNNIGPMGLILIVIVVLVLFGRGKISGMMGEMGRGITSFKQGLKEGDEEQKKTIEAERVSEADAAKTEDKDKV
ncbi:twin-arginine translocase TatA/TatE family subunit [Paracoccaceae bacterium GXU_MW_L88]